ncbi:hypothetical protein ACS0TY_006884 [Phlomoides rotata]
MDDEEVLDLGNGGIDQTRRMRLEPVCLVGKLCTEKSVNSYTLIEVMIKAFRAKGRLIVRDWGHGLLIFSFELEEDRDWVIQNLPWHFDNALFVIKPLSRREQPSAISLSLASFWIRVYDLPLVCQTTESVTSIAGRLGTLVSFESHDPNEPVEFIRVKVEIDITKPLRKGLNVRFDGVVMWIPIKYESLPTFCFCCGTIGHFFKACKFYDRDEDLDPVDMAFGPSLKALAGRKKGGRVINVDKVR